MLVDICRYRHTYLLIAILRTAPPGEQSKAMKFVTLILHCMLRISKRSVQPENMRNCAEITAVLPRGMKIRTFVLCAVQCCGCDSAWKSAHGARRTAAERQGLACSFARSLCVCVWLCELGSTARSLELRRRTTRDRIATIAERFCRRGSRWRQSFACRRRIAVSAQCSLPPSLPVSLRDCSLLN